MKKAIFIFILVFSATAVLFSQDSTAEKNTETSEIVLLKKEVETLKQEIEKLSGNQQQLLQQKPVENDLSGFLGIVENSISFLQWFISIVIILGGGFFGFFFFRDRKSLDEYKKDITENTKREMQQIQDKIAIDIARILHKNPMAIKEFIEKQLKEQQRIENTSVCIVYQNKRAMEEVRLELVELGVRTINEKIIKNDNELISILASVNDEIILVADSNSDSLCNLFNKEQEQIKKMIKDKKQNNELINKAFFYYGVVPLSFFPNLIKHQNYANSLGKVSENVTSLINAIDKG